MTGRYQSTEKPMVESLAELTTFLESYSNFIELHLPPMHFPQKRELACAFRLTAKRGDFNQALPYFVRTLLLPEPKKLRTATRGNRTIVITENDVLARRWMQHIEHMITFVIETPDNIRAETAYRNLGGYLATGNGTNILDALKPQIQSALEGGQIDGSNLDLLGSRLLPEGKR